MLIVTNYFYAITLLSKLSLYSIIKVLAIVKQFNQVSQPTAYLEYHFSKGMSIPFFEIFSVFSFFSPTVV